MTTTTMHFGPEWMRTKPGISRPAPSPPLTTSPAPPGNATYSALVTPASNTPPEAVRDVVHPFRYSKEELLRIYKEGGGRGGLGIEVERWEGIVREVGYDPVGLKEMGDAEKKLFAGPLNSEVRRRQSTDFLSPLTTSGLGERPKLNHATSSASSPLRERIGSFMGRRRGDSTDQAPLSIPRKLSLSSMQGGLASPRDGALPSPRVRPGFEGVLGETWSSRRRTSENIPKVGPGANKSDKETDGNSKGLDIKEEEEDVLHASDHGREPSGGTSASDHKPDGDTNILNGAVGAPSVDQANSQLGNMSISGHPINQATPNEPPPGLADVEWSYVDPQGQVQGPFKADTMQRWYSEGYFQPNLLMKRTHLDTDWTPVGELVRRAGNDPVFLSALIHAVPPPGLSRPLETVVDRTIPERSQHLPYQPVPTRSVRSSTLDSYLQNGSGVPDSPSSSLGGNFLNGSPDPNAFDNRTGGQVAFEQQAEPRMPFATGSIGAPGQRRVTAAEPMDQLLGNRGFNVGRNPGMDGLGFGGTDGSSVFNEGATGPFGQRLVQEPAAMNGLAGSSALNGSEYGPIGGMHSNQGTPSRILSRDVFGKPILDEIQPGAGLNGSLSNHSSPFISHAQAYPQTPLSQFTGQDGRSLHSITPISDRPPMPFSQQLQQPFAQSPGFVNNQSPWRTPEGPAFRRPGPFDVNHPTSGNTFVVQPIALSPSFGRVPQGGMSNDPSPWQATPQNVASDGWGAPSASLTVANLGQHDEQQRQVELRQRVANTPPESAPEPEPLPVVVAEPQPQPQATPTANTPSPTDGVPTQKPRRKSATQTQTAPQAPKVAPPSPNPAAPTKPPSPTPQPESKAPWAVDDDKKSKQSGVPTLREIQEAEAKKLEARKAAERERERAARANSNSEDFQPFTASWGLPTSQAGARSNSTVKESPTASPFAAPSPAPATPAVWTNATKQPTAKKTMKEIQEEEERRKKIAAKEKETIAVAARRAHAEATAKPAAATQQVGGAWTTVGVSGKTLTTALAAVRTVATPAAPAKATPASAAVVVTPSANTARPAAAPTARPAAVTLKSTPSKEDSVVAPGPSLEFLKWMGDSLKGLNSSINLEEITSMLLSFPLDPDPSMMEIISDLIYASSTTLDGRRFASEYVSRRKADATSRPKGATVASAAKQLSIADVVKTQPKPAQSEWGGFKVVNKKKKGGRS